MFSPANTKLKKLYDFKPLKPWLSDRRKVYSFDTLAGHACPGALKCKAKVIETETSRKLVDGSEQEFRCYAASQEVRLKNVYEKHKRNFEAIRRLSTTQVRTWLDTIIPANAGVIRMHSSGDFLNKRYFAGWMQFAELHPDTIFYAYTKSLPYWVDYGELPPNVILTASYGGKWDHMIPEYNLRSAIVVHDEDEADAMGLEIDRDDSHASDPNKRDSDFALEIHGSQRAGTEAAVAWEKIRRRKIKMAEVN